MATATAEQVIVGKMSLPQIQGQIALFVLPQNFVWLKHFTAEEIAEFFTELLEALGRSEQNNDWSFVADVIETWKASANILADPVVSAAVDQGLDELNEEQALSWEALKQDLNL